MIIGFSGYDPIQNQNEQQKLVAAAIRESMPVQAESMKSVGLDYVQGEELVLVTQKHLDEDQRNKMMMGGLGGLLLGALVVGIWNKRSQR